MHVVGIELGMPGDEAFDLRAQPLDEFLWKPAPGDHGQFTPMRQSIPKAPHGAL